ncbi:MAG: cytochrome c family protein [Caulobacteraceae bacterium]|nr:cytochrome c family protein [Caulobacteraceae bacterium]
MSGNLELNKIFGAALATGLVILGVREVSTRMFASEPPEKMGYQIEVAEGPEDTTAGPQLPPDWGTVLASADLAAGEAQFKKCASCHKLGANGIGPDLTGVVGRPVASHAGFSYSEAMVGHRAEAPNWSYDALDHFLSGPGKAVPGTKMSFAGLKKQEDRINLIAWLRTQGSSGYPIPAPDPSRQAGAAAPAAAAAPAGAPTGPLAPGAQGGQAPVAGAAAAPTQQNAPQPGSGATPPKK